MAQKRSRHAAAGRLGGLATAKHRSKKVWAELGKKGGKATARSRSQKERSEAARKAAKARWAKKRPKK